MRFKKLLVAGVAIPVVALVGCSSDSEDSGATSPESSATENGEGSGDSSAAPEPDLDGIPEVVAEVNGEEISRDEFVPTFEMQFQQMAQQSQMTGESPDQDALEKQVVENLISTELLRQAADERGLQASDADVDKTLADLAESNQMSSVQEFLEAVEEQQGLSEQDVRTQIGDQLRMEQLVAAEGEDLEPTRAEVKEAYAMFAQQQEQAGQEAPPLKQIRSELKEQLRSQKKNSAAATLVETLREDAEITIHI